MMNPRSINEVNADGEKFRIAKYLSQGNFYRKCRRYSLPHRSNHAVTRLKTLVVYWNEKPEA